MSQRLLLFALLCMGSLPTCGCGKTNAAHGEPNASASTGQRVVAGTPVRKPLTLYSIQPGQIEAFETTPLFSRIAGYVDEVKVDIGDEVGVGEVLITLLVPELHDDVEHFDALVSQVESEIKQSEASLTAAQSEVQTSQAKRDQALAGVEAAEAVRMRWDSERKRVTELATRGSVTSKLADETESQFRGAAASYKQANAAVKAADAALAQATANVAKAEADVKVSKSRLRVAQANLARAKTMLAYAEIKAPFNGVVTRRDVDTGHFVQPASGAGAKALLVVARMDKVRVFVDVPETEAAFVQGGPKGDAAVVRVQALGDREFKAQVTRTAWSLDPSNRSLRTEIDISNEDRVLRPGMYAMATILIEKRDNALAVPAGAVTRQGNQSYCCRVESGKIRRQPVQLGIRTGDDVEIVSGLQDSDVIVLARTESLADGQEVDVTKPEEGR